MEKRVKEQSVTCLLAEELLVLGRETNDELRNKQTVESRSVTENA